MSTTDDLPASEPGAIQFDQAEYQAGPGAAVAEPVTRCAACKQAIHDLYYEGGGHVVCASCRDQIEALGLRGSRVLRVLKAFLFGGIAAAIGGFSYFAITQATGWNIGLVSVVVGVLVGKSVRAASGGRGGRFYQLVALFLTYTAIVGMNISLMFAMLGVPARRAEPVEAPKGQVAPAEGKARDPEAEKVGARDAAAPAQEPAGEAEAPPREPAPSLARLVLLLAVFVGFLYTLPVHIALGAPISGLIFGFALWEAWKINRRVEIALDGPFRLAAPAHGVAMAIPTPEEAADEP